MNELNVQRTTTIQIASTLVKFVSTAESVEQIARLIADALKYVVDMGTVFLTCLVCARIVSMCAEANRGCRVILTASCLVVILQHYFLRSLT